MSNLRHYPVRIEADGHYRDIVQESVYPLSSVAAGFACIDEIVDCLFSRFVPDCVETLERPADAAQQTVELYSLTKEDEHEEQRVASDADERPEI